VDGSDRELLQALAALLENGGRGALATVVRAAGSTPQRVGARMLLDGTGRTWGTVGGGRIEAMVLEALRDCLVHGRSHTQAWELGRTLGMCCGGRMEVLLERVDGAARLIMFGAGHVACPTARLAQSLDFRVSVVDEREELNTAARFPHAERLLLAPSEAFAQLAPTAQDFVLVMTHDHQLDQHVLELALKRPHRYIGMIGSRRKVLRIVERMRERDGAGQSLDLTHLHAPVGLDIGAVGPEEIAVSVLAELIAVRRDRAARHMRLAPEALVGESAEREP
jgi:xanthine dehydrogenase accessory factor